MLANVKQAHKIPVKL